MNKMMRTRRSTTLAGLFAALMLMIGSTTVATASASEQAPANSDESLHYEDSDTELIEGGTTQSTDPTRYDYVPAFTTFDANGVGATGSFSWEIGGITYRIPTGMIGHRILGSGLKITEESAIWGPSLVGPHPAVCNYQFQFQNRFGNTIYTTKSTPLVSSCTYNGIPRTYIHTDRTVKKGLQCARLYVNGSYRGEQCHNITP